MTIILSSSDTASLSSVTICCATVATFNMTQTNWEPELTDLFSQFAVVADAAAFPISAVPVFAGVRVLTQCSCEGLLW
jgi:hypothetical protein